MKKVVLIPDSFKGTLSSAQICDIMEQNVKKHFPECEVVKIPVADGGEGSVNCFLTAAGGEKRKVIVKNPYMEDMEAFYGILPDKTAVIGSMCRTSACGESSKSRSDNDVWCRSADA